MVSNNVRTAGGLLKCQRSQENRRDAGLLLGRLEDVEEGLALLEDVVLGDSLLECHGGNALEGDAGGRSLRGSGLARRSALVAIR